MRCRHSHAFPWIWYNSNTFAGLMWCPDCGAIREIRMRSDGEFTYAKKYWVYPRGIDAVLKRMEKER